MRPENEPTQSSCRNRRDKNCPGRDVLCLLHAMMKVRLNHIAKILEGGIEGFGNPDQRSMWRTPAHAKRKLRSLAAMLKR